MTGVDDFAGCLARARAGHPDAWTTLYDAVGPIVYSYLRAQSLADPEDVAGETFLQVVRDIDRFEGTERQFRSWTLSIAHHRMLDARRAARRRPASPTAHQDLPADLSATDDLPDALESIELEAIESLLDGLTDEQRTVVVLRVLADLTLEETATLLDRTVGSVKALQHRAFGALRARLEPTRNPAAPADAHSAWHS